MEISYGEAFLLAWSLASSVYALVLRERHRKFVWAGAIALDALNQLVKDVADSKVTLKRVDGKIEIVELKTGEENAV